MVAIRRLLGVLWRRRSVLQERTTGVLRSRWIRGVMTCVLALLYFLVVVPAGLLVRMARDPLQRRWDPDASSYWNDRVS